MLLLKNIKVGKIRYSFVLFILFFSFFSELKSDVGLEGTFTELKILDKISSKNTLLKLKNEKEFFYKDLSLKSLKCKNSEFDDNPEIIAYLQVKDLKDTDNDEVFVFNGWTFSSSPSINTFDHPVYDIWLIKCSN